MSNIDEKLSLLEEEPYAKHLNSGVKLGLHDELDPEMRKEAFARAKERLEATNAFNQLVNLSKDSITVPGQRFCVVCWVGPTFRAKTDIYGFRIMGAFDTLLNARKYALKAHKIVPTYDIGIMEMNLWCLGYPDQSDAVIDSEGKIDEKQMQINLDHKLNEFIVQHKTEIEESKQLFEARRLMLRKSTATQERDISEAPMPQLPEGRVTEEMKQVHTLETMKWSGKSKNLAEQAAKMVERAKLIDAQETGEDNIEVDKEEMDNEEVIEGPELDHECKQKIPNQEFAAISYVGHTGNNNRIPICIKGVFANQAETETFISKIMQIDDTYDIFVAPLYSWLPCDPDITGVRQKFKNSRLNELLENEENDKLEAAQFHHVKETHGDLNAPVTDKEDFEGKGTMGMNEVEKQELMKEKFKESAEAKSIRDRVQEVVEEFQK